MERRVYSALMSRQLQLVTVVGVFVVSSLPAQTSTDSATHVLFVNSEWERYTRALQDAGLVPLHPWSVRAFGPREQARLWTAAANPWSHADALATRPHVGRVTVDALPVETRAIFNSRFPYGFNDGPVWAGRGLTTLVEGGVTASSGPFTLTLAPVAFRAENGG